MTVPRASAETTPPDPSLFNIQIGTSWTPFDSAELDPSSTGLGNLQIANASLGFTTAAFRNSDSIVTGTYTLDSDSIVAGTSTPDSDSIVTGTFTLDSDSIVAGTSTPANWFPEALEELEDACSEPLEEGYLPVSDRAKNKAVRLLYELAPRVVQAPMVHSTQDGGIAIDFRNPERDAILLIICEGTGEGVCFYDIGDKRGRARSSDASDLIEDAGWSALARMGLI